MSSLDQRVRTYVAQMRQTLDSLRQTTKRCRDSLAEMEEMINELLSVAQKLSRIKGHMLVVAEAAGLDNQEEVVLKSDFESMDNSAKRLITLMQKVKIRQTLETNNQNLVLDHALKLQDDIEQYLGSPSD